MLPVLLALSVVLSQEPQPIKATLLPNANDAYLLALNHCNSCKPSIRHYLRYVWITDADPENVQETSLVANLVSRGAEIVRVLPVGESKKILLACLNVRDYAPRDDDKREWLEIWEDFQFDPAFNRLFTKDTLKFAAQSLKGWRGKAWVARWRLVDCPPYVENGQTFKKRWTVSGLLEDIDFAAFDLKDVELIRISCPTINPQLRADLEAATGSAAPLVTHGYLTFRAMATIRDKGIYDTIYGGRYYQLCGIKKGFKKGTDEENFFEQFGGIGNVQAGVTAREIFEKLPSDRRAAKLRSDVTGSGRGAEFYNSLTGLLAITRDLKNQSIDIGNHPLANLAEFIYDGAECLFTKANGLQGGVLFDGQGGLVDEVPPDIAKDHTIPQPHTARLQMIGCISCHWAEGSDGWKLFNNDVKTMTDKGFEVIGDTSNLKRSVEETRARIKGLYQAMPSELLLTPRNQLARAVLKATGDWKDSKKAQADCVQFAGTKVVGVWRKYYYDMVDADTALREIGIGCDPKDAQRTLDTLLVADVRAAVNIQELNEVVIPNDPRISALSSGIPISRVDWNFVRSFVAERCHWRLGQLLKEKK